MALGLLVQSRRDDIAWGDLGFSRAEECTAVVGQTVLDVLTNQTGLLSKPASVAMITSNHVMPLAPQILDGCILGSDFLLKKLLAFCQFRLH